MGDTDSRPADKNSRFLLLRYFSIAAGVTMLAVIVVVAFLYREVATGTVVKSTEHEAIHLARVFANVIWPDYGAYVDRAKRFSGDALRRRTESQDLFETLKRLTEGTPIIKVKIYGIHGLTVFSTEARQMGADRGEAEAFKAAANHGRSVSKLSHRERFQAIQGEILDRKVVETYLPIHGQNGQIEGVFEIYTDVTDELTKLTRDTSQFIGALLAIFALFYGVLFFIVQRADRIIATQYDALASEIAERERLERVKGDFVANVSHELRTPLTSISGALGLIAGGVAGDLDSKGKTLVDSAFNNCQRLGKLVNDILDVERIGSGRLEYAFETLDLNFILQESVSDNQSFAETYGVSIEFQPMPSAALVKGDPMRLSQVMANLLSNAIKFSPRDGVVGVRLLERVDCYRIEVEDRGPGIPADFHDQVFDRFAQAEAADNRTRGGSGLGLTISKTIVEDHGGAIDFISELGQGSLFFTMFPKAGLHEAGLHEAGLHGAEMATR